MECVLIVVMRAGEDNLKFDKRFEFELVSSKRFEYELDVHVLVDIGHREHEGARVE